MAKEEKKSIIADAITDYKKIQEAAEVTAQKKLAEEFPDKFQSLIKEELDNNKKTSEKEPYKKVKDEESTKIDESETKKENATMGKNQKETKKVINEERDKDFTGDVEKDTPNLGKGETEKGNTYTDKPTTKKESLANDTTIKEEFDISDLDIENVEGAIDGAGKEDEIITMDQIEEEINKLDSGINEDKNDPFDQVASIKGQLQEMLDGINELEEQKNHGGKQNFKGRENGGPTTQMIDETEEEVVDEQKNHGGKQNFKGRENGGPTTQMIDETEEELPAPPDEIDLDVDELDEAMGMAHSSSKHAAGDHLPGKEFAKQRHKRVGSQNSVNESKKVQALLEQNKKLTKRINESNKYKEAADKLLKEYKTAVGKYRSQLKEMTVFNTNLAHVNNLLVNESLALTQDDKVNIINKFKDAKTISESKEKYDNIISEMNESKKTLSEGVEEKITKSVGESSKNKLDEVDEKTAYKNNEHLNKMKNLMEYIERGDKKTL